MDIIAKLEASRDRTLACLLSFIRPAGKKLEPKTACVPRGRRACVSKPAAKWRWCTLRRRFWRTHCPPLTGVRSCGSLSKPRIGIRLRFVPHRRARMMVKKR
jgi:hypothetical protein